MKNKLVTVYFLCSLIFGVFCIGGFAILSAIKGSQIVEESELIGVCGNVFLPENKIYSNLIYKQKCSPCHKIHKRLIGPGLAEVAKKREVKWMIQWLNDRESLYLKKDSIALKLKANQHSGICPPNPKISNDELTLFINGLKEVN